MMIIMMMQLAAVTVFSAVSLVEQAERQLREHSEHVAISWLRTVTCLYFGVSAPTVVRKYLNA